MSKFQLFRLYKADKVPDAVIQEIDNLFMEMDAHLIEYQKRYGPNIILSTFNLFHAAMVCEMVTENGLKSAAETEALGLIKNIEYMSGQSILKKEESKEDENG